MKCRSLLRFVNFFPYTSFDHEYYKGVTLQDFTLQLVLSFFAAVVSLFIFSQALEAAALEPLLIQNTEVSPPATRVLELFQLQERGEIIGLNCPCSSTVAPFSSMVNVSWKEDEFCTTIREDEKDSNSELLMSLREAAFGPLTNACTRTLGQSTPGGVLSPYSAELMDFIKAVFGSSVSDPDALDFLANAVSIGICGSVFGIANKFRFTRADAGRLDFPSSSTFGTPCLGGANPLPVLLPEILSTSTQATLDAHIRLQHTRFIDLVTASVRTCSELNVAQGQFLRDLSALPVSFNTALSPLALELLTRNLFNTLLSSRVNTFIGLVPGSLGARDLWTESPGVISGPNAIPGFTPMGTPPEFSDGDYVLSSRLPFVRASSLVRSSDFFYVPLSASSQTISRWVTPFGGFLRARILNVSMDTFPMPTTDRVSFAPPWFPGVSDWVPVGDDTLTLMDACAAGLPIQADLYALFPMFIRPGFEDVTTYADPWPEIFQNLSTTGGLAGLCTRAQPFPPITIPLQCPTIYNYLGKKRKLSSYYNYTSNYRGKVSEYLKAFPRNGTLLISALQFCFSMEGLAQLGDRQRAWCSNLTSGDLQDRINLYQFLLFDAQGPNLTFSPQSHYSSCKPSSCVFTVVRSRSTEELALEAVGIYGGNVSAVLSGFSFLAFFLSAIGQLGLCAFCLQSPQQPATAIKANPLTLVELTSLKKETTIQAWPNASQP